MDAAPPPVNTPEPRTDGKAIGSLVCGILSLVCFSFLTGVPAIILGHISRSSIRKSMGRLKGEGMALAGLIMGYVSLAIFIPMILIVATISIPSLLRSRQAANESAAVANLRTINTAEVTYLSTSQGKYGNLDNLIDADLLDSTFHGTKAGFNFTVTPDGDDYAAEAVPASSNTARYAYVTSKDGVVRYSFAGSLAPPGQAGLPVN